MNTFFEIVLATTLMLLIGFNGYLVGCERGYSEGYGTAMADVYLGLFTAESYIKSLNKPVRPRASR